MRSCPSQPPFDLVPKQLAARFRIPTIYGTRWALKSSLVPAELAALPSPRGLVPSAPVAALSD